MILKRLFDEKLAQASYIVADDHSKLALIVDPNRDIQKYIDELAADKLELIAITETHIHADYVSGSRELAEVTGAQLYLSGDGDADWQYKFADESRARIIHDGDTIDIGAVRVQAIHTPGHTPEHMSFLVSDTAVSDEPMGALTGDFIFVGDVGRPDLLERAAGFAGTMEKGARTLFKSLQKFKKRPDYLQIWPGHGAGSACGKALGAMPQSTLGYERLFNWALVENDEEAFVKAVLAGQPEPPLYFATMKRINRDGVAPSPTAIPPVATASQIAASKEFVVDIRDIQSYADEHMRNSINIPRNRSFLNWAGALLPYDRDLLFIGDASEYERQALLNDLARIGIERIAGVFPAERLDELKKIGVAFTSSSEGSVDAVETNHTATILDVRGRAEYDEGHIPNAVNIPLNELQRRLTEVPTGEVWVHCKGGSRSAMAASILQQAGRDDITNMVGGFTEWSRAGLPVETGNGAH